MVVKMILSLLFACNPQEQATAAFFAIDIAEYHMMDEFNSWTYRDDAPDSSDALPDETQLMLAQNESGVVNFRRGSRWVEAQDVGSMEWSFNEGLTLESWNLPFGSGTGPIPLSSAEPEDGDVMSEGDWTCTLSRPETMWTFYAEYDSVLYFDCDSSSTSLDIFFAKRAGLIHLQTSDYELDLVAPW